MDAPGITTRAGMQHAEVVTFLFTDVEGSTRLLEEDRESADQAIVRHHELLVAAVAGAGGTVFETVGDAVYAAFDSAGDGLRAAIAAQRGIIDEDWAACGIARPLRIRVALHRGPVERRGHRFFGMPLFAAARLLALAHGGQTLVSDELADEVGASLPAGARLRPLGRHRLKDLGTPMVVHQLDAPDLPDTFAPIRSLGVVHLPEPVDAFIGRVTEVEALRDRLAGVDGAWRGRLVTLTGPGGTGKSRLAIEAARGLAGRFPDGIWWVSLAALTDPELIPSSIGAVVGAAGDPVDHLRTWSALVVLDNLEQVIEGAPSIARIIERCPDVVVLVTSREPLRVSGEQVLPLDPLDTVGCIRLLEARAAASAPGIALDPATADSICRALDRLPLAVELAAAQLRVFTPDQLRARLADGLDAIGHGMRDRPDRQRTLRATIAWSVDLLEVRERDAFERLAVFVGGWSLDAAEAIAGLDPDTLLGLVDRSLVRRGPDGRFGMLETIRAFASERLETRADARRLEDDHARWYGGRSATLHRAVDHGESGADDRYLADLDADGDNAWAALARVTDGRALDDTAHRLVYGTYRYWMWRGRGRALLERIRSLPWAAVPFAGAPNEDARSGLAELERYCGDPRLAIALKQAELMHPATEPPNRAALHADLADLCVRLGMLKEARAHADAAIALRRRLGDRAMEAHALCALVYVETAEGHAELAATIARDAVRIIKEHADRLWMTAELGGEMTPVLVRAGDVAAARRALTMGMEAARRVRHDLAFALLVDGASGLAAALDDHRLALMWAGAAEAAISRSDGFQPLVRSGPGVVASARNHLDRSEVDRLMAAGAALPIEAIADEVSSWLRAGPVQRP